MIQCLLLWIYGLTSARHTHRWKGENVATTEVTDHLVMVHCIEEANVYGVAVPGKSFLLLVSAS